RDGHNIRSHRSGPSWPAELLRPVREMRLPRLVVTPVVSRSSTVPPTSKGGLIRCRVVLSPDSGWDVSLEIEDRVVCIAHCTDWHRVERLRALLERPRTGRQAASSARA